MTPSEIIDSHLRHLTRRLVARSPLLFFRPGDKGMKMDIADLFPGRENLPMDPVNPSRSGICGNPDDLLAKIVAGEAVAVDFPGDAGAAAKVVRNRCGRLRTENTDYLRTTGQWGLSLAWPLIHVPPPEGRVNPFCAPLLFWKVELRLDRGKSGATICPVEKEPAFNFVLNARLQFEEGVSLEWAEDDAAPEDISALIRRVKKALSPWRECAKDGLNKERPWLRNYRQVPLPAHPAILPCAVLGMANFKRHALFGELGELKDKVLADENCGLLGDFLRPGAPVGGGEGGEFPESEKWLVERSDSSQTAAVCQARESSAMLLEGPPGTGKSQTIVNMIADALRRRESVVVACHHRAALDVVRKRLKGAGLDDLVVQIVAPKTDRDEVVRRIADISDETPPLFRDRQHREQNEASRPTLSAVIESSENLCDERTLSFVGDRDASFSVRGDLRARIERLREKTGFSPFSGRHAEFLKSLRCIPLGFGVNSVETVLMEQARIFSDKWGECGYPDNPWLGIPDDWDSGRLIPDLRQEFSELAETAASLANAGAALSPDSLALAGHPIMLPHYPSLAGGERKGMVGDFLRLVRDTRRAFRTAGLPVAEIWRDFMGGDAEIYARRLEAIGQIEAVQTVARLQRQYPALALVAAHFAGGAEHWPDILSSAIFRFRHDGLPRKISLPRHEQARKDLGKSIREKTAKDRSDVCAQFTNRLSARNTLQGLGLLRQRAGGGRPMTRLRDLYGKKAGFANIREIFPALLTDPDSASQLLRLDPGIVDLLIVDEASQMFTADALPLLYRAKRAVICGDSMQMPPSDFFMMTRGGDEDDGDEFSNRDDDDENAPAGEAPIEGRFELLEAAKHLVVQGGPARRKLEVHYRSRPAELIAFSNHAFYGGKLHAAPDNFTPPSFMGNRAIRVDEVGGQFASGVNRREIRATIGALSEIWRSPDGRKLSVGVIVFNTRQADALKEAIDEEGERDETFRNACEQSRERKDKDGEEVGFFVRSVEHVQGDERDVVILATTYGGDSPRYGPISAKGKGRRRLNVAVTRAKVGMIVLTSLDIDRISNEGEAPGDGEKSRERWFLWKYMQHARAVSKGERENSAAVLRSVNPDYKPHPVGRGPESEFERQVGAFLEGNGYAVDYQKGESGFRIDLGVKADATDSDYLCGIECDGRFWHSGWRARANDIWRQEILEGKGWKILRIWSDAWFDDGEKTKAKFLADLANLKAKRG